MLDGLIQSPATQKVWNCFDTAAGIDRDLVMAEVLTDDPIKKGALSEIARSRNKKCGNADGSCT